MTDDSIVEAQRDVSVNGQASLAAVASAASLTACGGGSGASSSLPPNNSGGNPSTGPSTAQIDASRFLRQAAFGGNLTRINEIAATSPLAWLNGQMGQATGGSLTRWLIDKGFNDTSVSSNVNGDGGWPQAIWWKLFSAPDPFRQRATLALSELFVVSRLGLPCSWRNFAVADDWEGLETRG